jgi:multidrug efflux pump subunit AcrA (membrane-fusion protein)
MKEMNMNGNRRKSLLSEYSLAVSLFLLSALLAGCGTGWPGLARATETEALPVVSVNPEIIAEGRLVPKASVRLSFNLPGKMAALPVEEGQQVFEGALLASLTNRAQLEAAVTAAELDVVITRQALESLDQKAGLARAQIERDLAEAFQALVEAQQNLDDLDTSDFQDELDDSWIEVTERRDDVRDAEDELDKYQDLDPDNPTRVRAEDELEDAEQAYTDSLRSYDLLKNSRDQAEAALALAQARHDDLRQEFNLRRTGPHPDDREQAEASLKTAQAQLAAAQAALEDAELIAPYYGTLVELNVVEGDPVLPNQPVALLADTSAWYVETTDLTEMDVVRIDPNRPVSLRPDALPDLYLGGTIESISQMYVQSRGDITYTVRILLRESDPRLRWGMTFQAVFTPLD